MTERYEVTNYLQKELVNDPTIFGTIEPGDDANPGVHMESVHWLLKTVDNVPLLRPVWFFDTAEQGEGLSDVGTHLVDLAAWTLFPQTILDYRKDVKISRAKRFPTVMTADEYKRVTGVARQGSLDYYCNTIVEYALRGVHIKLDVLWKYQNPTGGPDTQMAVYRGTRSNVEVRDAQIYVVPKNAADKAAILAAASKRLAHYSDVKAEDAGDRIKLAIPDRLRVGHEAHFAEVAKKFFEYLKNPASMPAWEKANMMAKYYVTTTGVDVSNGKR